MCVDRCIEENDRSSWPRQTTRTIVDYRRRFSRPDGSQLARWNFPGSWIGTVACVANYQLVEMSRSVQHILVHDRLRVGEFVLFLMSRLALIQPSTSNSLARYRRYTNKRTTSKTHHPLDHTTNRLIASSAFPIVACRAWTWRKDNGRLVKGQG